MVRKKKSSSKDPYKLSKHDEFDSEAFAVAMEKMVAESHAKGAGFGSGKEMENRIAEIVWGKFREANIGQVKTDRESSQASSLETSRHHSPPEDIATIVISDVEESTSIWEENSHAMQEAVSIHDKILRRNCDSFNGYEVDTEGDRFFLAFHTPLDAFLFALKTQLDLYKADWSSDLFSISAAAAENSFRGLRVRMGIHQGPVSSHRNEFTGRLEYYGEAMTIAKRIGAMSRGGQILTSSDTWNAASYKAESDMDSPQVLDLGNHFFSFKGGDARRCRILQLVPASLAYDYFAARRRPADRMLDADGVSASPITGRQFEPLDTALRATSSFHDAPYENLEVTIAFIRFSEIEIQYEDPKPILSDLIRLVCDLLVGTRGYHCQNNMLAFPNISEAIEFGLGLMRALRENYYSELPDMITFGCVHDSFLAMGPHKTTGRADYYGKVVNRAAHVSATSELGTVNFGVSVDNSNPKLPLLKDEFDCHFKGVKELKGVQGDMAIYEVTLKDQEENTED
mmetsp:Transcript_20280/g.30739  ORF Transcript_20280/g.30739 Transcript_20280/m.30739 type:complete len:513 (-) Transcript_20280:533-2071(-)